MNNFVLDKSFFEKIEDEKKINEPHSKNKEKQRI